MQTTTFDGFFFTPGDEDGELELSFFDYNEENLKNAEKVENTAYGDKYHIAFFKPNDEGFVETVIIRRIVIDKDGFGVVYEQTKNEQGKSSYTRNGFSITEFEWQNESNGRSPFKK